MKKLVCWILILLLPLLANAEEIPMFDAGVPLVLPGENPAISDCLPLKDGGALLNVLTTADFDGNQADMLYLIRIAADGRVRWQTRYHLSTGHSGIDRYSLALSKDSITVTLYSNLLGNEHCTQTSMIFNLATGKQEDETDVYSIPAEDVPTITHCGDYRVEQFFGDYSLPALRTLITHIPTGRTAEYDLSGQLSWFAFGDNLLSFRTGEEDRGNYWMYDATCLPVVEEAHTPFGAGHRYCIRAVESDGMLYIFASLYDTDPDVCSYAVYPMDKDGRFGDSVALFTLPAGHSLADVATWGNGFLLTEYYPWVWQQPARCALSYLSMDGQLTTIEPELVFPRGDAAVLLSATDAAPVRVILRKADDDSHRLLNCLN